MRRAGARQELEPQMMQDHRKMAGTAYGKRNAYGANVLECPARPNTGIPVAALTIITFCKEAHLRR